MSQGTYIIIGRSYGDDKRVYYNKNNGFCKYRGKNTFTLNTDPNSASRLTKLEAEDILERILTRDHRPKERDLLYHIDVHKIKEEPISQGNYVITAKSKDTGKDVYYIAYTQSFENTALIDVTDIEAANQFSYPVALEIAGSLSKEERITDFYKDIRVIPLHNSEVEEREQTVYKYKVTDVYFNTRSNLSEDMELVKASAKLSSMSDAVLFIVKTCEGSEKEDSIISMFFNGKEFKPEE